MIQVQALIFPFVQPLKDQNLSPMEKKQTNKINISINISKTKSSRKCIFKWGGMGIEQALPKGIKTSKKSLISTGS